MQTQVRAEPVLWGQSVSLPVVLLRIDAAHSEKGGREKETAGLWNGEIENRDEAEGVGIVGGSHYRWRKPNENKTITLEAEYKLKHWHNHQHSWTDAGEDLENFATWYMRCVGVVRGLPLVVEIKTVSSTPFHSGVK